MQHTIETQGQPRKLHKPAREDDTLRREVLVAYSCDVPPDDPSGSGGSDPGTGSDPGSGGDGTSFP